MKTKRHVFSEEDPTLKTLSDFGGRIADVLQSAHVARNDDLEGALDDLLGAVCALISARECGFKGKSGKSDFAAALDRAEGVANAEVWLDGNWMAGFHFNSAAFRISAVFDRLPKAISCCHRRAAEEYQKKTGRSWTNKSAHKIRTEVVILKHNAGGTYPGRKADLTTALSAVAELLSLAEALA